MNAKYALQADLVKEELRLIEQQLENKQSLIFYIPCHHLENSRRHSHWMQQLHDDAGKNSYIAFSAVAGLPTEDHQLPHPYWEFLRKSQNISAKAMVPIINGGGVHQGDGLWPSIPFDQFELFFPRISRYRLGNPIVLSSQIPPGFGFLRCSLWVAGQLSSKDIHPEFLIEEWFREYKPQIELPIHRDLLRQIRSLVIEISRMRSIQKDAISHEEIRLFIESLLLQLKYMDIKLIKEEKNRTHLGIADYFEYFYKDARRMIAHSGQSFNISTQQINDEPSFWTFSKISKIQLLDQPLRGESGSTMEKIYLENRKKF
jgi:hypothetical protein